MNNDKEDINSYLNSNDLAKYLQFLDFNHPFLYRQSEITSIEQMFQGNNHSAIILLNDHLDVGHFVVLRKDNEDLDAGKEEYTYFDCLGDKTPQFLVELFEQRPIESNVNYLTKPLMGKKNNICGKYCVSFMLAGNILVQDYYKILDSSKLTPDFIINNLFRIDYTNNML